jgi:preprotein translocase subunit YajC
MHMNCFNGFLADATTASGTPGAQPQGLFGSPLVFIVLMGVMMYFLLIRPQQQRTKQQKKMLEAVKSGDEVVTSSGIIGTIVTIKDSKVTLRSGDAKFEITKEAISAILEPGTPSQS